MRVSVIIPCYNSIAHLARTIESVLAQSLPPAEIICVDDASTDGTWELLNSLAARANGLLRIYQHPTRRGTPAATRNTAIAHATGDWIAFLDHDDLWIPEKLKLQSEEIARQPEAGLIHSDCWEEFNDNPATRVQLHLDRPVPKGDPLLALFHRNFIFCLTAMVRRDWIDRCGPLNESVNLLGKDDYEYWLRLARQGCKFAYVPEPLAIWRRHETNASNDKLRALTGQLDVVEHILKADPELALALKPEDVRSRRLWLRLEIAQRLVKSRDIEGANARLAEAWRIGNTEPTIWALRSKLAIWGTRGERAQRSIRHAARKLRDRSRLASENAAESIDSGLSRTGR